MKGRSRQISTRLNGKEQGFTLLELLIVVTILSSIAYVALDALKEDTSQTRFNETENRLNTLARAIIGTPSRTLGAGAEISGYVADTGQLPSQIRDLIIDPCQNTAAGKCGWNADGNLRYGWRGPYLTVSSIGGDFAFRDGWGNIGSTVTEDDDNFGWNYSQCRFDIPPNDADLLDCSAGATTVEDSSLRLEIISTGRDTLEDDTGTGYDADTKLQFHHSDYAHDTLTLSILFTNQTGTDIGPEEICLKLTIPHLNDNGTSGDDTDDYYELIDIETTESDRSSSTLAELTVNDGEIAEVVFDFSGDEIPWGVRGYQVFKDDGFGTCDVLYSGHVRQTIRLLPRTTPPQIFVTLIN